MNLLMLLQSTFPMDMRVRRESFTLKKNGHNILIIALKDKQEKYFEIIKNIIVYRIPKIEFFKKGKQARPIKNSSLSKVLLLFKALIGYGFEYFYFTVASFLISLYVVIKYNIDIIHTHNPPDTLFLVAGFYKLFGKQFVYDHHDLSPELYLEKYNQKRSYIYNMLLFFEKMSCKLANIIITTNESYKKIEIKRCKINPEKIYIVRYGPDLNEMKISNPIQEIKSIGKTILCYLGSINIQDGIDLLLITLFKIIYKQKFNNIILLIIGDGDYLKNIKILAKELKITNYIIFTGLIKERDKLNKYLSTADIFIDTAPYSFLNESSSFIKLTEYMVYGKPIISFALKESMYTLKNSGVFIPPNDTDEMAKAIIQVINDKQLSKKLGFNAKLRIKQLSWEKVSKPLVQAYETLYRER